jgi:hypothetical protein
MSPAHRLAHAKTSEGARPALNFHATWTTERGADQIHLSLDASRSPTGLGEAGRAACVFTRKRVDRYVGCPAKSRLVKTGHHESHRIKRGWAKQGIERLGAACLNPLIAL